MKIADFTTSAGWIATLSVVLPSFIIILLVVTLFSKVLKHPISKKMLQGIKPAMVGIIIATGLNMLLKQTILNQFNIKNKGYLFGVPFIFGYVS